MRFCAVIEQDENSGILIRGRPLLSYQLEMVKRAGIKDIFIDSDDISSNMGELAKKFNCKLINTQKDMEKIKASYDGLLFIGGNMFFEKDFLTGFDFSHSTIFIDETTQDTPNIIFYIWKEEKKKKYNISGKIWKKIVGPLDIFYAENKLSLLKRKEEIEEIELFSFDLDGTTILGKRPIPGAREFLIFLKESGRKFSFLTNNSSRTNSLHAQNLKEILDYPIEEKNVTSSIDSFELYIKTHNIHSIYPFVNNKVKSYLLQKVQYSEDNPDLIAIGFNTDATYEQMSKVSELIFKGVPYVLIHPDFRCPTEFGYIPDAGSFGKMFELTTDKKPIWVGGKPNPIMIDTLVEKYGVPKEKIGYVGDRLYTDIDMAKNAGIFGFLVLTGETSLKDFYLYIKENPENYDKILIIDNLLFLKAFLN